MEERNNTKGFRGITQKQIFFAEIVLLVVLVVASVLLLVACDKDKAELKMSA